MPRQSAYGLVRSTVQAGLAWLGPLFLEACSRLHVWRCAHPPPPRVCARAMWAPRRYTCIPLPAAHQGVHTQQVLVHTRAHPLMCVHACAHASCVCTRRAADNAWCPCERLRVAVPRSVGARTTATTTTTTAQPNPASASSMPNGGAAAGSEVLVIDLVEEERIAHSIEADTSGNEGQAAGCATGGDPPKERLLPGLQAGGGAGGGPGPQNRGGGRGLADVMQGRAGPAAAYATAAAAGAASAAAAAGSRAAPQPAHFVMQAPRGRGQGQQQGAAWHGAMAGRDTLISAGHGSGTGRSRASAGPCAPARQGYDTSRHAAAQPGTAAALGVGANNAAVAAAGGGARTAAAGSSAAAACQPGSTAAGPLGRQPHVFTKSKKAQRQMLQQQQKQQQLQLPSVPQPLPLGQCAVQQDVVDLTLDADSEGEEDRGSVGITGAAAAAAAAAAPPPPSLEAATGLVLGQSSSGPVSTSWSCARCTFLNSACSLVCEMCAGPHCSA